MIIDILSTPKFQSCGEIESTQEFEFYEVICVRRR